MTVTNGGGRGRAATNYWREHQGRRWNAAAYSIITLPARTNVTVQIRRTCAPTVIASYHVAFHSLQCLAAPLLSLLQLRWWPRVWLAPITW